MTQWRILSAEKLTRRWHARAMLSTNRAYFSWSVVSRSSFDRFHGAAHHGMHLASAKGHQPFMQDAMNAAERAMRSLEKDAKRQLKGLAKARREAKRIRNKHDSSRQRRRNNR
jgi:hypothetical protein